MRQIRPSTLERPRSVALVHVAIGLVLLVALEVVLLVDGSVEPTWLILAFPLMGCTYGAAGIEAWRRRPSNRVGPILVLGAWAWLLAGLHNVDNELLVVVGQFSSTLGVAVVVHLVLAFPSGRLPDVTSRWIVAAAYFTTTVLEVPLWLFDPDSPALISDDPSLERLAEWTQRSIGSVILVAIVRRRLPPAAGGDTSGTPRARPGPRVRHLHRSDGARVGERDPAAHRDGSDHAGDDPTRCAGGPAVRVRHRSAERRVRPDG